MFFLQLIALLILVHFFEKLYSLIGEDKRKKVVERLIEENLIAMAEAKMLGIFKKKLVNPPEELNSPASLNSSKNSKLPDEILNDFISSNPSNAFSISFGNDAFLAYSPSNKTSKHHGYVTITISMLENFNYLHFIRKICYNITQVVLWFGWHILCFHG